MKEGGMKRGSWRWPLLVGYEAIATMEGHLCIKNTMSQM